jgi:predicted DNA-binding transcriptional regulator
MSVELEDEEGVIKGPHYYLLKRYPLEKLEKEVYALLMEKDSMPLSAIWRNFDCHLWEVCAVLKRLKEKGLLEESAPTPEAYM